MANPAATPESNQSVPARASPAMCALALPAKKAAIYSYTLLPARGLLVKANLCIEGASCQVRDAQPVYPQFYRRGGNHGNKSCCCRRLSPQVFAHGCNGAIIGQNVGLGCRFKPDRRFAGTNKETHARVFAQVRQLAR